MQRLLLSAAALSALAVTAQAQCFEQNFGTLAPLSGGQAGFGPALFKQATIVIEINCRTARVSSKARREIRGGP